MQPHLVCCLSEWYQLSSAPANPQDWLLTHILAGFARGLLECASYFCKTYRVLTLSLIVHLEPGVAARNALPCRIPTRKAIFNNLLQTLRTRQTHTHTNAYESGEQMLQELAELLNSLVAPVALCLFSHDL